MILGGWSSDFSGIQILPYQDCPYVAIWNYIMLGWDTASFCRLDLKMLECHRCLKGTCTSWSMP